MSDALAKLGALQLSVLQEIGNIGAGHAATALSLMMSTEIDMNVPRVHLVPFNQIDEVMGGSDEVVVGVFLRIEGEISGSMFLMLTFESAKLLLQILLQRNTDPFNLSELEYSALMEVGNILGGSYLAAMSDFTGKQLYASVPAIAIDMAGAILSAGLVHIGQVTDTVLVVDTKFWQGKQSVDSHFFFLPDPGALETIFQALGVDFA